jgi:hypothetical protein
MRKVMVGIFLQDFVKGKKEGRLSRKKSGIGNVSFIVSLILSLAITPSTEKHTRRIQAHPRYIFPAS